MKLSDTHLVLLSAAAKRDNHALELPADMEPAAAEKLVSKLAGAGLIEEIEATGELPVWRRVDDTSFALRITDEGLNAIGVDEGVATSASPDVPLLEAARPRKQKNTASPTPKGTRPRKSKADPAKGANRKAVRASKRKTTARKSASPSGTKLEEVKTLLLRKRGATIKEMMHATSWLPHTTRAVLTGLRKRGFGVEREAVKDKPSVYRITSSSVAAAAKTMPRSARAA